MEDSFVWTGDLDSCVILILSFFFFLHECELCIIFFFKNVGIPLAIVRLNFLVFVYVHCVVCFDICFVPCAPCEV